MPAAAPTGCIETMTPNSSTATLDVVPAGPLAVGQGPSEEREPLVRPADLVTALTGVALCFFSLFVFVIANWQYLGPDVESVSMLGWLAPLVAGVVCILAAGVAVGVRLAARRSAERPRVAS